MERIWRIELLGGLRVIYGEERVTRFRVNWSASLIACLAYHRNRSFRKEELIELLWPELGAPVGGGRFRQALCHLCKRLEASASCRGTLITVDGPSVLLNPEAYSSDVAEFQSALQAADRARHRGEKGHWLKRAVELYRGELLPGLHSEWVRQARLHLDRQYHHALDEWINLLWEQGELSSAVDWASQAVRVDPLREESHEQLIRLLAAADQPEAALRQYRELEQFLKHAGGVAPSGEMAALVRAVQRRIAAGTQSSVARPGSHPGGADQYQPHRSAEAALRAGQTALGLGHYQRAAALLRESLRRYRSLEDTDGTARALEALGCLAHERYESDQAHALLEESLALRRTREDRRCAAILLRRLSEVAQRTGDLEGAAALTSQSQAIWADLGDRAAVADALARLGRIAAARRDPARERGCYEESLAIRAELDDAAGVAAMRLNLARLAVRQGEYETAQAFFGASLGLFEKVGDRRGVAQVLAGLTAAAFGSGSEAKALAYGEESLAIFRALGDPSGTAHALLQLGSMTLAGGDNDRSRACFHEAETLYRKGDNWVGVARSLAGLGNAAYAQGDYTIAARYYRESLTLRLETGDTRALAAGVQRLARVIGRRGDWTRAARLFGAIASFGDQVGQNGFCADRFDDDAQIQSLREALGKAPFAAAWAEGRAMSLEEAVAAASRP